MGDSLRATISDLHADGRGIAEMGRKTAFVSQAYPGPVLRERALRISDSCLYPNRSRCISVLRSLRFLNAGPFTINFYIHRASILVLVDHVGVFAEILA